MGLATDVDEIVVTHAAGQVAIRRNYWAIPKFPSRISGAIR